MGVRHIMINVAARRQGVGVQQSLESMERSATKGCP
jgi:hypothetical protein